jgi:tetrahydromethanopterin S-methyltransferase subunit F
MPANPPPVHEDPDDITRELQLAFAPIHKRAFGIAVGTTLALVLAILTIVQLLVIGPEQRPNIELLRQYFYGYSVSWPGVFIGAFWAGVVGFVIGWFSAFCRNLVIAVSIFITRTKAELGQTRDFLDHI